MAKRPVDTLPTVPEPKSSVIVPSRESGVLAGAGPRYEIGVEIARGGMGRVVEATDTRLGRVVALKEALSANPDVLRRFEREIGITARLEHPAIVPLYDAGQTPDGTPFYSMRKVSGRPLDELVVRASTLDERLALVSHVLAAARAIAHAHSRGVLHRDLKPSNILVGGLGETVVIDWGLAKVVDDDDDDEGEPVALPTPADSLHTRVGTVLGTPGFMAPEQARAEPVDARGDVYALGATLYYVLARTPPESVHRTILGVPAEISTIIAKALAPAAADRYLDAGGFAEDLQRFLDGQLVASHRYSAAERLLRLLRRHRLPIAVASAAVVAIAIVGWLAITRVIDARDRAAAALAESRERNEQLVLERARELVTSNPTLAVALVKPLAIKHWRAARAVGIAANLAGVARSLPGSPRTMSLELATDGVHAVAGGDDGVIRHYDLATRTTRELARLGSRMHVMWGGEDRLIICWFDERLVVIDVASTATRELKAPTRIAALRSIRDAVWIVGHDGSVWRVPLDGTAARRIAVDDDVWLIEAAPDHSAIALGGNRNLWLVHGEQVQLVARGRTEALGWSRDSAHLAAAITGRILEVAPSTGATTRDWPSPGGRAVAWHHGSVYAGSEGRVTRFDPDGALHIAVEGRVDRLVLGADSVIAVSDADAFTVLHAHALVGVPPASALDALTASPTSRYVIGGSDGRILVWNLDAVLPHEVASEGVSDVAVLADDSLLVQAGAHSRWLAPASGAEQPVELPAGALAITSDAAGDVVAIEREAGRALMLDRGTPHGTPLEGAFAVAAFSDPEHVIAGTTDGELRLYHRPDLAYRVLARLPARPVTIDAQPGWFVVALADRSVWRIDLASARSVRLPRPDEDRLAVAMPSGDVLVGDAREVLAWHRDGSLGHQATLETPAYGWARRVDDRSALFGTTDTGASLVELDRRDRVTVKFPPGARVTDGPVAAGFFVTHGPGGKLAMSDLLATGAWPIAFSTRGAFEHVALSPDARHAYVVADGALLVWTFDIRSAQQTAAFLDQLTDASASQAGNLVWP